MSVKELVLIDEDLKVTLTDEDGSICFYCSCPEFMNAFRLDRSQAHLLMLYLQEHLGYVSISKDRLND